MIMKNENFEIDNFLRPEMSSFNRWKQRESNFGEALVGGIGLFFIGYAFFYMWLFVTAPETGVDNAVQAEVITETR